MDTLKLVEHFKFDKQQHPNRPAVPNWAIANYYNPFYNMAKEDVVIGVVTRSESKWGLVKTDAVGVVWVLWGVDKKRRPIPRPVGERVAIKRADLERGEKGWRSYKVYDGAWYDALPTADERARYAQEVADYERAVQAYNSAYERAAEQRRLQLCAELGQNVVFKNGAFYVEDDEKRRAYEAEQRALAAEHLRRQVSERGLRLLIRYLRRLDVQHVRWETPEDAKAYRVNGTLLGAVYANAWGVIVVTPNDDVVPLLWDSVERVEVLRVAQGFDVFGYSDGSDSASKWVTVYLTKR